MRLGRGARDDQGGREHHPSRRPSTLTCRVIDYGTAAFCETGQHLHSRIGTARYAAPEIIDRDYNAASDVWSVGAIAYTLLCGRCPFKGRTDIGTIRQARSGEVGVMPHESACA